LTGNMVSPLFQVNSIVRLLSTPFNFAQTFAPARAVLFWPKSTTVYKLPSTLMISPERMSAVVAMLLFFFYEGAKVKQIFGLGKGRQSLILNVQLRKDPAHTPS